MKDRCAEAVEVAGKGIGEVESEQTKVDWLGGGTQKLSS